MKLNEVIFDGHACHARYKVTVVSEQIKKMHVTDSDSKMLSFSDSPMKLKIKHSMDFMMLFLNIDTGLVAEPFCNQNFYKIFKFHQPLKKFEKVSNLAFSICLVNATKERQFAQVLPSPWTVYKSKKPIKINNRGHISTISKQQILDISKMSTQLLIQQHN